MKIHGFILRYPLGCTNIETSDSSSDASEVTLTLNTLKEQLKKLDIDGDPNTENQFDVTVDNFIDVINNRLKMKADLELTAGQDTPDDTSDDKYKIVSDQLPDSYQNWEGE